MKSHLKRQVLKEEQLTKRKQKLLQQYTHLKLETDNQDRLAALKEWAWAQVANFTSVNLLEDLISAQAFKECPLFARTNLTTNSLPSLKVRQKRSKSFATLALSHTTTRKFSKSTLKKVSEWLDLPQKPYLTWHIKRHSEFHEEKSNVDLLS